nr:hypothetical protein [Tanacetum cinerariifolium]
SSSKLSRDQTSNSTSSTNPTPKGRIRRSSKQKVVNSNFEENLLPPPVPMAENQIIAQLLQAPTDGYEDAIIIPEITANNFELKHAANYGQGNTGFRPQMVANQIRPPGFPSVQNTQNNFNRGNNFNQYRGGNFNQSNFNQSQLTRPQVNQPLAYQAPAYQAPVSQIQSVSKTDFESYVKANDAVLRNI